MKALADRHTVYDKNGSPQQENGDPSGSMMSGRPVASLTGGMASSVVSEMQQETGVPKGAAGGRKTRSVPDNLIATYW